MSRFEGNIKKEHVVISVFVFLILVVTAVYIMKTGQGGITLKSNNGLNIENRMEFKEKETQEVRTIRVNIRGEVEKPGIVEIEKGQVINDVVDLAGGFTEYADVDNINLVYELFQNVTIRIPSIKNDEDNKNATDNKNFGEGIHIITDDTGVIQKEGDSKSLEGGMVNINSASKQVFAELPGIGEVYAQRIVDYRNEHGRFESLEQIMDVSGIGEKTFQRIRSLISLH